jgi:hypothetical protein
MDIDNIVVKGVGWVHGLVEQSIWIGTDHGTLLAWILNSYCFWTLGFQWLCNPPYESVWESPWDIQFGWCKANIVHDPFPFPCQGRNASCQDLSFRTFEKVLPLLAKACVQTC